MFETDEMPEAYTARFVRAFKQAPWRTQTQSVAVWSVVLMVIAVLGGLYLSVASRAGAAGRDLQRLEARQAELVLVNDQLRATLSQLRSVTRLNNRARELGFLPAQPEQIEYLAVSNYPVMVQAPPLPAAVPSAATASMSFGGWLADALGALVPHAAGGRGG